MFDKQLKTEIPEVKKLIISMSVAAHNARVELLSTDLNTIEKNNPALFIYCVLEYYRKLAFFPNEEIKKKFKQFGFYKRELEWFADLREIQDELVKIENSDKIIVFPYSALFIIVYYFELKIARVVFNWAQRRYGKNYLNIFKKFFKQRKYHKVSGKSKPKNKLNDVYTKALIELEDKKFIDDFLLKANKGKVDSILIPLLLERGFYPKKICRDTNKVLTENEFIWLLSDLIKLIMKEKAFLSENDFFKLKEKKGDDYRLYIIRLIKKIGNRTYPFKEYVPVD